MALPNGQNFANCYMDLCKQQRLRPLPVISVTLPHSLDFTTDRVKMDDWGPILNSLSLDQTLKSISVRSRYQCRKPLEEVNSEDKARAIGKAPVVLTRFLLEWLSHSVGQCVRNSPVLTCLELEGMPLPPDCLAVLCIGLSSTESLQHLSLQRCYIGDNSCELVCRTIADVQSIRSLNLSQCDLSPQSGPMLAAALSRQKLSLYHDTWKQSLRYREPNLEAMPGLRRLTLNGNPQLGNSAISQIIDAIRDSLWLKALDLQNCGLTENIGTEFSELLEHNTTLTIVDVRMNLVNEESIQAIMQKLDANNEGTRSEYRWLSLPQKDNRIVSAGFRQRNTREQPPKGVVPRSRSVISRQPKRPCQLVPSQRTPPTPTIAKRTKMRPPPSPPSSSLVKIMGPKSKPVENLPRPSLHLDLKAQICSPANAEPDVENVPDNESDLEERTSIEETASLGEETSSKIEDVLRLLAEARTQHDQLLEETKRTDLLLAEERARREVAEAKLQAMKDDLVDLENALKEKEKETRGYLLVSQRSLDDICSSFDRLLEMLDSVTKNPNGVRKKIQEENAKDDIKRQVALLIRKTRSENLKRDDLSEYDMESPSMMETSKKCTRSESDMHSTLPPISPIHVERNIGDSPDVTSPSQETFRAQEIKLIASPGDRARAIFAQLISGESVLNIGSHVG